MRSVFHPVCGFLVAALGLAGTAHANLIVNGGFNAGDAGFTSQYAYQQNQVPEATIYVGANASMDNPGFTALPAKGDSRMLIVNGASTPGMVVWGETGLAVRADTTYYFSTWIAALNDISPALLGLTINGQHVGVDFAATAMPGRWQQVFLAWNSGASTTADISLTDDNTARIGNDFALDGLSLETSSLVAVPEPASLPLLAAGLAILAVRRRRA